MESFGQREAVAGYEHDEEDRALVEGNNGGDADGTLTVHGRDVLFGRVRSFTTNGWLQSKIEAARARGREALSMLQDSLEEELDTAVQRSGQHVAPMRGGLESGQGMAVQSVAPDGESEQEATFSSQLEGEVEPETAPEEQREVAKEVFHREAVREEAEIPAQIVEEDTAERKHAASGESMRTTHEPPCADATTVTDPARQSEDKWVGGLLVDIGGKLDSGFLSKARDIVHQVRSSDIMHQVQQRQLAMSGAVQHHKALALETLHTLTNELLLEGDGGGQIGGGGSCVEASCREVEETTPKVLGNTHAAAFRSALECDPVDETTLRRAGFFGVPDDDAGLR